MPAYFGIQRSLGEKYWVLLGCNMQFVVIGVVPNLLHVVPVSDDAMLDGISELEDTPLCFCFLPATRVNISM